MYPACDRLSPVTNAVFADVCGTVTADEAVCGGTDGTSVAALERISAQKSFITNSSQNNILYTKMNAHACICLTSKII